MSEEKKEGKLSQEGQNGKVGREISKPPMQRRNIPKPPPPRDIPTLSQTTSIVQSAQAGKTETPSIQKTEGQKEKKSKDKKKVVFWSLLASGIGVIVIAVVLLLVFLLPKEEKYEIDLGANVSVSEGALTGTGSYKKGDSVTIVAEEIEGYRFTGWTLNGQEISDKNEYTFTIDETTEGEYTANYAKLYDITLASDNVSVVIEGNKTQAIAGESISFTIPSNPDYRLLSVKVNDEILTAQDGKYTFTMPESDVEIVVESSKIYSVTLGEQSEYGKFNIEPMQAIAGETITVNFELKEEYIDKHSLKRLYYIKAGQGEQITIENNTFIMPEGNVTVYAEFNNLFNINLTTNIEEEITLEGQGTYLEKDKVTITAPQVEGYRFRNWTYNGNPVTTEQEYIITSIDSSTNGTYIANYDKLYSISVNSSNGIVTIVGDKTNAIAGESVEFTVTPNPDYRLIEVKVNNKTLTEQDGKYTFAMPNENATINVTYAELFDISVTSEHGQVEITENKTQAIAGENVEFTVTPNPDYRLIEVKVNNKTSQAQDGKYTFVMPNENATIDVTYAELFDISVTSEHGQVEITEDKTQAIENEDITFTITPSENYRLDEVSINNGSVQYTLKDNTYSFKMPAGDVVIAVSYNQEYAITIDTNSNEYIQIDKEKAIEGEEISFIVEEREGYRIDKVKYNETTLSSENNTYTFSMPKENVTISVTYIQQFEVDLVCNIQLSGENQLSGEGIYDKGQSATITAPQVEGYRFKNWTLNGSVVSEELEYTIANIDSSTSGTYIANYDKLYSISVNSSHGTVTITDNKTNAITGESVEFTVTPNSDYRLIEVKVNNETLQAQEGKYTFIMPNENTTIDVTYAELFDISVTSEHGQVEITENKTQAIAEENVEFTVAPNPDYRLIEVKVNNKTLQAQEGKYTFAMPNENATINVTYAELFDISVTSEHGQVEITEDKTQAIAGENVEFTVAPNSDHRLIDVKLNGQALQAQDGKYTFVMPNENVEIIVTYNQEYAITVDSNSIEYIKIDKEKAIEGEEISFIVEEREGYRIDEVKYNETILTSENNSYTFSMPAENVSISVTYIQQFEVDLVCNIQLSGESQLSGEGIYDKGQSATITAPQVEGYRFRNWTLNGSVVSEELEYTIANIDSSTSGIYIANYDKLYNITINSSHGTVTITDNKTNAITGESVEFTVTPNSDYRLINVKVNNETLQAQDGKYTFVMPNENVEIIVTYNQEYSITVDSSATEMIANLSSVSAVENERLTFLSLAPATITDTEITIQEFKVTSEEGEELSLIQSAEEFSFVMPASNVTISAGTKPTYRRLDDFEFSENSVIGYNKDSEIIKIPAYYDKITINSQDYIIERESETSLYVLDIGNNAFEGNTNITRVSLHDSLQSIGEAAFKDCVNLEEVSFAVPTYGGGDEIISGESQIETIADQAFYNCAKLYLLESFSGTKLKTIGSQAFYNCESLVDIILPSTLQTINNGAFELCTNLAIVINESNLINIDKGQTSNGHVGYYAYRAVNKSTSPNVDIIEDWADGGVKYYQDGDLGEVIAIGPLYPDTDRVVLFANTTEILPKAFNKCLTLEKIGYPGTIDQWASIKFGEEWALKFDGDKILDNGLTLQTREGVAKDITITVESISNYAFQGITSIETVLIGDGVLSIGDFAFSHNLNLIKVYCENFGNNSRLTLIGDAAFGYCGSSQEMGLGERSIMIAGLGAYDYVDDGVSRHMFEGTLVDELIIANPLVCAWSDEGLEHLRSYVSTRVKVNQRALEVSGSSSQFWDNFTESEGLYLVWN